MPPGWRARANHIICGVPEKHFRVTKEVGSLSRRYYSKCPPSPQSLTRSCRCNISTARAAPVQWFQRSSRIGFATGRIRATSLGDLFNVNCDLEPAAVLLEPTTRMSVERTCPQQIQEIPRLVLLIKPHPARLLKLCCVVKGPGLKILRHRHEVAFPQRRIGLRK